MADDTTFQSTTPATPPAGLVVATDQLPDGANAQLIGLLGGPADTPRTVTFLIQAAGQDATTYVYGTDAELVRLSTGVYAVNWVIVDPYTHQYRFEGTGACQQEQGGRFYARPRNVG